MTSSLPTSARTFDFDTDLSAANKVNATQLDGQLDLLHSHNNQTKSVIDGLVRSDNTLKDESVRIRMFHPEVFENFGAGGNTVNITQEAGSATQSETRTLMTVSQLNGSFTYVDGSGETGSSLADGSVSLSIGDNARQPGRIYCEGRQFKNAEQVMYMNGMNTPWRHFNEFGATSGATYDSAWWEAEFAILEERGINSTRIWINDDSLNQSHTFSATGELLSVSALYWTNLDDMLARAAAHGIYVKLSVLSFDHFKWTNADTLKYHLMLGKESNIQSWIDQYIIPLADRHANNLFLYAIDLGNECDNFYEDQATASATGATCTPVGGGSAVVNFGQRLDDFVVGQQLYVNSFNMGPVITRVSDTQCIATNGYAGASATFTSGTPAYGWGWLGKTPATYQRYIAMCAAAIHNRPTNAPLVTVGVQSIKYSTAAYGASDYYSDSALSGFTGDSASFIDFHSIHYYQWAEPFFPLKVTPTAAGLSEKPATYGELPAGWENLNGIYRNGGWVKKWWPRTFYSVDDVAYVEDGAGNKRLYRCATAGTSGPTAGVAGQDVGPTGTGSGIADGGCVWNYWSPLNSTWVGLFAYSAYNMFISSDGGVWVCTTGGTTANEGPPTGTGPTYTSGTAVFTYRRQAYTDEQDLYDWLAANGWSGHYPWTSNAFGFNGGLYHVDMASPPNKIINWAASIAYAQDAKVFNDTGKIYRCLVAGTSAGSGGPTGTGSAIVDGGVTWCYERTVTTPPWTSTGLAIKAFSDANTALLFPDTSAPWTNTGLVIRQSKGRGWVEPGGMIQHRLTFRLSTGTAGLVQTVGPYDGSDGITLIVSGADNTLGINVSSAPTVITIQRADWNVDQFDGIGPSGITLDVTKTQTLVVELAPTGMRPNRVGFLIEDEVKWAHVFHAGNQTMVAYPRVSSLPARWQIHSTSAIAQVSTLTAFDATARTDDAPRAMIKRAFNGGFVSTFCGASAIVELAAFRIASGSRRSATMVPLVVAILGASSGGTYPFEWWIMLNPTEGAPTAWSSISGSVVEWTRLRGVSSDGVRIAGGYGANSIQSVLENMDELLSQSLTEGDVLSIQVRNIDVSPNYFWFALDWEEG